MLKHRLGLGMLARRVPHGVLPLALVLLGGAAAAQPAARLLSEPPHLLPEVKKKLMTKSVGTSTVQPERVGRETRYVLPIKYTQGKIYNPATGKEDPVELRSYGDSFIAPTITMKPGETVRITLRNQLPVESCNQSKNPNQPSCFNTTNLHSHGLWVSPSGNSDNVLLNIKPGVDFQYEYNVPEDHPAGTFWYHPHVHGSTAMQVASGMAGALIIQGERFPTPDQNGDLDTLLKPFEPRQVGTRQDYSQVMLFQQIPYACFDGANIERESTGDPKKPGRWTCKEGQVGKVQDFQQQFGPGVWGPSGRYTAINGLVQPRLQMEAGRVYRWRLIDAGVRESIGLRIARAVPAAKPPETLTPEQEKAFIEQQCSEKEVVSQWEVATDGLTRSQILEKTTNRLHPGYRSDVLVVFPSEGDYCLYDAPPPSTAGSITAAAENPRLLGWVTIKGGKPVQGEVKGYLREKLLAASNALPANVRQKVQADLKDELKTTLFVPHPVITDEEVKKVPPESVTFNIDTKAPTPIFQINGQPYAGGRIDHTLILGTSQEWILKSDFVSHPFHIHVNPFQIVSIKDKTTGQEVDPSKPEFADYAGMKGTWKDTLLVQQNVEIRVRTRYERYIGDFVLHCHILDHEDQGMMQNVRIAIPDGQGGAMALGHDHH